LIEPSALAAAAAANNAHWCDLVCHAHCGATSFGPTFWICLSKAPPLYPNLVTLGGAEPAQAAAQIEGIEAVLSLDLPTQPAIKDSFRSLDLTNRGFDLLFEALWLARDPVGSTGRPSADAVFVRDATELAEWEAAWRLEEDTTDLPPRLFPENLLIEPDIGFVALRREGRIVAGAAVNSSADVVGMTNLFTGGAPADSVARAVAETISMRFPGLPIVDYETADRARELEGAGFRTVAPLAVWLAR
jgi:hypothetical protein